jgi:SNF2 family DNA or RNA helicase
MRSRSDLHDYQEAAVSFIKEKGCCGLALDMGLGKTVSTLTAISDLFDAFAISRVLVIAPLRVAQSVWPVEVKRWSHLSHLRVRVATGSARERLAAINSDASITVINRENVVWLLGALKRWPFDMVVIDESSSFKSPTAKRFRALRKVRKHIERIVLLTGTPSPNGLMDLWPQQFLIDIGEALGKTITGFRDLYFDPDYMGYNWTPKPDSSDKIHALLKSTWLSMSASDYLQLPPRIDLFESVSLDDDVLREYLKFEKLMLLELDSGDTIEAVSAGVLAGKLLQYANGAQYKDDSGAFEEIHTEKLDALREIVENNPGENILLAYNYKHDLVRLKAAFPGLVVLDASQSVIERWNRGEIRLLACHPQSAGHGLNLQDGGALCVWFGLNWSLELYQQFNARLHRQGQTKPVRIVHIVAEGTIDERVIDALRKKDATQSDLLNALKLC